MILLEIGSQLKQLRESKKMTQKEVAEILNVTPQTISKWERNKSYPDLDTLVKLSNYFQVSTDQILGKGKPSFFDSFFSKKKGRSNMKKENESIGKVVGRNETETRIFIFSITGSFISEAGFQTQRFATKLDRALKEKGLSATIELFSSNKIAEKADQADVILLTPEFAYIEAELNEQFPNTQIISITSQDYGLLNVGKILKKMIDSL